MLKKIETLLNPNKYHSRATSVMSASTTTSGNSGKSWGSGVVKGKEAKQQALLIDQPPLEMIKTDLNLTKHNSRYLSCLLPPAKDPRLCSNLAFDAY